VQDFLVMLSFAGSIVVFGIEFDVGQNASKDLL